MLLTPLRQENFVQFTISSEPWLHRCVVALACQPPLACTMSTTSHEKSGRRLSAAHASRGAGSCLSVRTKPLTATGAPSQTSAMPCHTSCSLSLFPSPLLPRATQRSGTDHVLATLLPRSPCPDAVFSGGGARTHACPQCLPSDTVPVRSGTWTLRRPAILHRHLPSHATLVWHGMAWHGMAWHVMVEVCEGAPVAVSGWVLTDRHDVRPCAASSLLRVTTSVSNVIGGTGTLGIA